MTSSVRISASRLGDVAAAIAEGRRLTRLVDVALREESLREDSWRILRVLSDAQDGLLMGEIAAACELPASTVTRLVDDLCDSGLSFRRPRVDDARKLQVQISRNGQVKLDRVEAVLVARLGLHAT